VDGEAQSREESAVQKWKSQNVMHGQQQRMQSILGTSVIAKVLPPPAPLGDVSPNHQKKYIRGGVINKGQSPGQLGKLDRLEVKNSTQYRDQNLKSEVAQKKPILAVAPIAGKTKSEFGHGYTCDWKPVNDDKSEEEREMTGTDCTEKGTDGMNTITGGGAKAASIAHEANVELASMLENMSLASAQFENANNGGRDGAQPSSVGKPILQLVKIGIETPSISSMSPLKAQSPTIPPSPSIAYISIIKGIEQVKEDKRTQAEPAPLPPKILPSCFVKPKPRKTRGKATPRRSWAGETPSLVSTQEGERRLKLLTSRGRAIGAGWVGGEGYVGADIGGRQDCGANTARAGGGGDTFPVMVFIHPRNRWQWNKY